MIELLLLASFFKSGDFFADIIIPGLAGAFVFALILNSILNKMGYSLW
jgi:hypothetical protein